jgi:small-conductance mechanosensitive channel
LGIATAISISTAHAQSSATAPVGAASDATTVRGPEGTVKVFNRDVFTFRSSLFGISAPDRARRASARIHEQIEAGGAEVVSIKPDSQVVLVQIDGATSFAITPSDVDPTEGSTMDTEARKVQTVLETIIGESRESRNLNSMLHDTLLALVATAIGIGAWFLAVRVRGFLTKALVELSRKHSEKVELGGVKLLSAERVSRVVQMGINGFFRLLLFILFYNWLSYVLSRFPFTRPWGEALSGFLFDLITNIADAVFRAVPGIVTAVVIFYIARWVNRLLSAFFERVRLGQIQVAWLDADVVVPTRRIAASLVWLFALAMAYPYLPGSDTEAFKGLSVLAGLMISLGASNLVGQAASGLILTYGKVFRKGEFVSIAEYDGTVTEVGMFTTRIRTGLGEEITIANSKILDSTTKNYSRAVKGTGFVLDTTVTIGYDTPWRQVNALLIEAARRTPGVLTDPAPVVFQTALSDWYPQYRLVCQAIPADPRPRALLLSNLLGNIQDVFNEYGVQIMSPQYFEDPAEPKIVKPENWYPAPAVKPPDA